MKIIGLAGRSGTGKTTIARHLEARGGVHVDGDRMGHEILESDADVIDAVREEIGEDVFTPDGRVDRRLLGAKVFGDDERRRRYNAIIHPVIRRRCGEAVERARRAGAPFVVVDAALLLDSRMPFEFDLMIALRATEEALLERLGGRGERTGEEVRRRLRAQDAIEKSFYKADAVVDTDKALDEVLSEVDRLVDGVLNDRT